MSIEIYARAARIDLIDATGKQHSCLDKPNHVLFDEKEWMEWQGPLNAMYEGTVKSGWE